MQTIKIQSVVPWDQRPWIRRSPPSVRAREGEGEEAKGAGGVGVTAGHPGHR